MEVFYNNFHKLVATLTKTFPNVPQSKKVTDKEKTIQEWYQQLSSVKHYIFASKYDGTFFQNVPVLKELNLHILWKEKKLSMKSKKYLWMYLRNLYTAAEEHHQSLPCQVEEVKDIEPPTNMKEEEEEEEEVDLELPNIPMLQPFIDCIPKKMLKQVQSIAEEESKKGKTSPEQVNFGEVTQKIFGSINEDDMKQMMQGVANMANNMNSMLDEVE